MGGVDRVIVAGSEAGSGGGGSGVLDLALGRELFDRLLKRCFILDFS